MIIGPLLLALLVSVRAAARAEVEIPFDEALAAAKASLKTPAGAAYQKDFAPQSNQHLASALNDCLGGPVSKETSFQVLLKVESDGKVSSALVRPSGGVTACVRDKLKRRTFPRPAEGTWKLLEAKLNP